jgi:hypothetical protein
LSTCAPIRPLGSLDSALSPETSHNTLTSGTKSTIMSMTLRRISGKTSSNAKPQYFCYVCLTHVQPEGLIGAFKSQALYNRDLTTDEHKSSTRYGKSLNRAGLTLCAVRGIIPACVPVVRRQGNALVSVFPLVNISTLRIDAGGSSRAPVFRPTGARTQEVALFAKPARDLAEVRAVILHSFRSEFDLLM